MPDAGGTDFLSASSAASARLRKTFKYPSDDEGSGVSRDEMDEQEQENFLANVRQSETSTNATYTNIFTALPLLLALNFLYYLFIAPSRATALLCLLSITSLASSAYIMRFIPLQTDESPTTVLSRHSARPSPNTPAARSQLLGFSWDVERPIETFVPLLNVAINAVLLLAAWGYRGRSDGPEGFWVLLLMPAAVLVIVMTVRGSMGEVQKGLGELEGMRYTYKGA